MSGRGKSGVPQKRSQHKVVRDKAFQITSPALKRLARKAGISRIGEEAIWLTRGTLFMFVNRIAQDSMSYAHYARRKTVGVSDVLYALKRQGRTTYGF